MILSLLLALTLHGPDPVLTPGTVTTAKTEYVCKVRWSVDRRHVTTAMKRHVVAAYGLAWADRSLWEIDHLVPRELAGADSILNLWPQPFAGPMGAHQKDLAENATHKAVCAGRLTLAAAQRQMAADWTVLYRQYVKGTQ